MLNDRLPGMARFKAGVGTVMAKTGLPPIAFTALGLIITAAGAWLIARHRYIEGALVVLVGACLDFVDGSVARATNRVTDSGGYLDSLTDRYADFVVLVGIGIALDTTLWWIVTCIALFGTLVTSYAKARVHETRTPPPGTWGGEFAERPDRYLVLVPAIFFHGVALRMGYPVDILQWGLVTVAVLANLSVLQRMRKAVRVLNRSD